MESVLLILMNKESELLAPGRPALATRLDAEPTTRATIEKNKKKKRKGNSTRP